MIEIIFWLYLDNMQYKCTIYNTYVSVYKTAMIIGKFHSKVR